MSARKGPVALDAPEDDDTKLIDGKAAHTDDVKLDVLNKEKQVRKQSTRDLRDLNGVLRVTAHRAKNLPDIQLVGVQDPYVYLVLGKEHRKGVEHDNGGVNPEWHDQEFDLPLGDDTLQLRVEVWNKNIVKDNLIGHCHLQILDILRTKLNQKGVYPLVRDDNKSAGEIELTFERIPPLVLRVERAGHLRLVSGCCTKQSPYVIVTTDAPVFGKSEHRTKTCKRTGSEGEWEEMFIFNVHLPSAQRRHAAETSKLTAVVYHSGCFGSSLIGRLEMSMADVLRDAQARSTRDYQLLDEKGVFVGTLAMRFSL